MDGGAVPAHLTPRAATALGLDLEARCEEMWREHWVPHPQAKQLMALLKDLVDMPRQAAWPNLLVSGESGMGKTMIMNRFRLSQPPQIDAENNPSTPVIYMEAPLPEQDLFWNELLEALNVSYRRNDRLEAKRDQALRVLARLDCRLLIIDEIHNSVVGTPREQQKFLVLLKSLSNKLGIPMVAVGTPKAMNAIAVDEQTWRRFRAFPIPLMPFGRTFQGFLKAYERHLPLPEPSGLWAPEFSAAIHRRSRGGMLGEVTRLVRAAGVEAMRRGDAAITLEHIKGDPLAQVSRGTGP